MKIHINGYKINVIDEPTYTPGSKDNVHMYETEVCRTKKYQPCCAHGIYIGDEHSQKGSVILLGIGGITIIDEGSVTTNGKVLFVAVADSVFCLSVPDLNTIWIQKVDLVACMGVYWIESLGSIITWGELDVCRYTASGRKIWCTSGPEPLTSAFEILPNHIEVKDFENDVYTIDYESGSMIKINN